MRFTFLFCTVLLFSCKASSLPPGGEQVTPQRPTLSVDTSTTAVDTFELEGGVYWDPNDSWSTPTTLKYGFSEQTELFFGLVPILHDDDSGATVIGDSQVGIRHRYLEQSGNIPSAAVMAFVNLPTGNATYGSPEMDFFLAGIVNSELESVTLNGYGSLDLRGDPTGPGIDPGFSLAAMGTFPTQGGWTSFAELAGQFTPDQNYDAVFTTLGGYYQVAPELVFDFGFVVGLSNDVPDLAFVFGFTRNFGRAVRMAQGELN